MSIVVPCDALGTRKATSYLLPQHSGPKYIRFAREATLVVTKEDTSSEFGKADVIRLRRGSGQGAPERGPRTLHQS